MYYRVWKALVPEKGPANGPAIPDTELERVGWVPFVKSGFIGRNRGRGCRFFSQFLVEHGLHNVFYAYKLMTPTIKRAWNAINKYRAPKPDSFDEKAFRIACDWLSLEFGSKVENWRILEWNECDIRFSTSPGVGFSEFCKTKDEACEQYPEDINAFWDTAHWTKTPVLWQFFCKTELRKAEKILADDARGITGPPMDYSWSFARMVQDFNKRLNFANFSTASALGFNKFSKGLAMLVEKLQLLPIYQETDAKKWDSGLIRRLLEAVRDFRWATLREADKTEENKMRLFYYYEEMICSTMVLPTGEVLRKLLGMPSGAPTTSYDNTLAHYIALAYEYVRLVGGTYWDFQGDVISQLYGDDEILAISEKIVDIFTIEARSKVAAELGITIVPEECVQSRSLEGLCFLGSRIHFDEEFKTWVGHCDADKIVSSLMFPDRQITPNEALLRAYALKVECFWMDEIEPLVSEYIGWLRYTYRAQPKPDHQWDDIDPAYMTFLKRGPSNSEIRNLWLGLEAMVFKQSASGVLSTAICTPGFKKLKRDQDRAKRSNAMANKGKGKRQNANQTKKVVVNVQTNAQPKKGRARSSGGSSLVVGRGSQARTVNAPVSTGTIIGQSKFQLSGGTEGADLRAAGREILSWIYVPSTGNTQAFLSTMVNLNPTDWDGSRLKNIAVCFEKFRFKRITFRYVPVISTGASGNVAMYYDRDPADQVVNPATTTGMREWMEQEGASMGPLWTNTVSIFTPGPAVERSTYFTAPQSRDNRLTSQGFFAAAVIGNTGVAAGQGLGWIMADYDCLLFHPEGPPPGLPNHSGYDVGNITFAASTVAKDPVQVIWNTMPQPVSDALGGSWAVPDAIIEGILPANIVQVSDQAGGEQPGTIQSMTRLFFRFMDLAGTGTQNWYVWKDLANAMIASPTTVLRTAFNNSSWGPQTISGLYRLVQKLVAE